MKVCMCLCICVCSVFFSETIGPMKPKFMWNHKRIGRSFVVLHYCQPPDGGAFSRDFTTILAPECRAFSGALKIEKLKAPLIIGPEGAVDTNDWCINKLYI